MLRWSLIVGLFLASASWAEASETAVLVAGEKLKLTNPGRIATGVNNKREQKSFVSIQNVRVSPSDSRLRFRHKKKSIEFEADTDLVGKTYTVELSMKFKVRKRHVIGDRWGPPQVVTEKHRFKIVVDYFDWPKLTMPLGGTCRFPATPGVTFISAKAMSSGRLECRCAQNRLVVKALKTCRTKVEVTYRIGDKEIKRIFRVQVDEEPLIHSMQIRVGQTASFDVADLVKQLELRDPRILEVDVPVEVQTFRLQRIASRFTVTGLKEGHSEGTFILEAFPERRTAKTALRYLVVLKVSTGTTTTPGSSSR